MKTHGLVGWAAAMLAACGGTASRGPVGEGPSDSGPAEAASPGPDGASPGPDANSPVPEAAAPDSDTGGDGGADQRIDPLEVGRTWTYEVAQFGTYPACPGGMHAGSAVGSSVIGGRQAIEVQSACANAGAAYYAVSGDLVQLYAQGTWITALGTPVQEGQSWSEGSLMVTWHSAGTVTVPAGTFQDCWSATEDVGYVAYAILPWRGPGPLVHEGRAGQRLRRAAHREELLTAVAGVSAVSRRPRASTG